MATENNINKSNNDVNQDCKCIGNIERCHTVLRVWNIKYEIIGTSKFNGVAFVQARTLKEAECVFYQNSKFNGFANRIRINCIEEVLPNPEPILLQEDSVAILDKAVLKSYPFLLKEDYQKLLDNLYKDINNAVQIDNGIATEINNNAINLRYDPEDFEIDNSNRIKLKNKKIQSDYLHDSEYNEENQELIFTSYIDNGYENRDYLNNVEYNENSKTLNILEYVETNQ